MWGHRKAGCYAALLELPTAYGWAALCGLQRLENATTLLLPAALLLFVSPLSCTMQLTFPCPVSCPDQGAVCLVHPAVPCHGAGCFLRVAATLRKQPECASWQAQHTPKLQCCHQPPAQPAAAETAAAAAPAAPLPPPSLAAAVHPASPAVPVARCAGSNPVGVDHLTLCPSG